MSGSEGTSGSVGGNEWEWLTELVGVWEGISGSEGGNECE